MAPTRVAEDHHMSHQLLPARVYMNRKMESEARECYPTDTPMGDVDI